MRSTTRRTSGTMTIAVEVLAEESSARIGFATGDDDIRINVNQGLEVDFPVSSKRCLFWFLFFQFHLCCTASVDFVLYVLCLVPVCIWKEEFVAVSVFDTIYVERVSKFSLSGQTRHICHRLTPIDVRFGTI